MRRPLVLLTAIIAVWTVVPAATAFAQGRPGQGASRDDEAEAEKSAKRKSEWELRQAPLPGKRNAGPCPYVKVLYDAARYNEFKDGNESSSSVVYSGEIEGVAASCEYKKSEPISLKLELLFALGKGPQATDNRKTFTYWVAVTKRNDVVLAKEYFTLPVNFGDSDRVTITDKVGGIVIPRATEEISGVNFEVLVGFDVTPEMAQFNREGKRFRVNAGAPARSGASGGR